MTGDAIIISPSPQATRESRITQPTAVPIRNGIELEKLLSYTEIGSTKSRPTVAYPQAGAFVKFLVETFGKDKFLKAYKTLENSHNKTVQQKNIELLEQIYGRALQQLEKKWEDASSESH